MKIIKSIYKWATATRLRKILSTTLALLILLTSIRFIFLKPKEVLADSLFTFNEGYGTAINDNNGNVSSGTITGAVWKTDDLCFDSKCLFFDGAQDLVTFADDADLDFAGADSFTINLWFRHAPKTTGTDVMVNKLEDVGTDGGYEIQMESDGDITCQIEDDDADTAIDDTISSTVATYDDNQWHFISCVKSGTSSLTLYIDNIQVAQDASLNGSSTLANGDTFYIGMDGDGTSNDYTGFIDEVKIYRSARTATEIKSDFTGQTPSRGVSASFGPDQSFTSNGLIGYWKMDENTGSSASDSSGNLNTGTLNGSAGWANGKFGSAVSLVSASSQDISIANESNFDFDNTTPFSISAWIRYTASGTETKIFNKMSNTVNVGYEFWINSSNKLSVYLINSWSGNAIYVNGGSSVNDSIWHHVEMTYDGSSLASGVNIFLDGNLESITTNNNTLTGSILSNTTPRIGSRDGAAYFFSGEIDDLRVYNRTHSPAEVQKLYNWAAGPVGYWKMDEASGTRNDSSSYGNNLDDSDSIPSSIGKFGNASDYENLPIDGNQSHTITDALQSGLDITGPFTIMGWANTESAGDLQMIAAKDGAAGNRGYFLSVNASDKVRLDVSNDGTALTTITGGTTVSTGTWYHIAGVYDGSNLYIYVNGVSDAAPVSYSSGVFNNSAVFAVAGRGAVGAADEWDGLLDDVRIYNYARNTGQIIEDMNAGHPAPGSPIGSAVAYWKLDEGYGTTAHDSNTISGGSEDLTLSTASWTNDGKFGKAWNGTGSNPYLTRADDNDLDFESGTDFTLGTWVKSDSASNPGASQYIIEKHLSGNNPGYSFYFNTSGQVVCEIDDDTTSFPEDTATGTTDFYDNAWHNVVCIRDITQDKLLLYVDGKLHAEVSNLSATGSLSNSVAFFLGAQNASDGGTDDFAGDIDEVSLFRSALTADQVKVLYNRSSSAVMGSTSTDSTGTATWSANNEYCPPGQGSACTPPVGEWKMDQNTGTTVIDTSGNGNDAAFNSAPIWVNCVKGPCLEFDGTDDNAENTSASTALNIIADLTVSAWVYRDTTSTDDAILQHDGDGAGEAGNKNYRFYINDANSLLKLEWEYSSSQTLEVTESTVALTNTSGFWVHIAATRNTTTNEVIFYENGMKLGSTVSFTNDPSGSAATPDVNLGSTTTSGIDSFDGKIDNIKIFNYEMTPAQIAWDYNRGGPVGWWKFDENTGVTANDSSGFANTMTLSASSWSTGKLNTAWNGDGAKWAARANDADFDFGASEPFSLSLWVKSDSATNPSTSEVLINKHVATNNPGYRLYFNTSGQLVCEIDDDTTSFPEDTAGAGTTPDYYDLSWHHVLCKRDITGDDLDLYVDGQFIDDDGNLDATGDMSGTDNLSVGDEDESNDGDEFFGDIDDVRIYRYALTAQQIQVLYTGGTLYFGN